MVADLRTSCDTSESRPFVALESLESGTGRLAASAELVEREAPDVGAATVEPGDVLFGKLRPYLAKTWLVDRPVYASTELLCLRPHAGVDSRWLAYVLRSNRIVGWAMASSDGTKMPRTSWDKLAECRIDVPPLSHQRAIADYLDAETARIDALIEKKRRIVELLEERLEAMIFLAVTQGCAGPRPMKESGLSWVARIPANWGTPTVSVNFELQLGKMLNAEASSGEEQYPYVRNVNVQWDRIILDDLATMHFSAAERQRCELRDGDLLVCEGGEVGRAAVWTEQLSPCFYQKAIHRLRPRGEDLSRYLMYCLRAAAKRSVFVTEGNLSTISHLTGEQLRVQRFPWPPVEEQQEIVQYLDTAGERFTTALTRLGDQLALLAERRQALVTAAVTGELAIPGVAA
jgi:type I restriction enzyme S subunit